MKILSKRKTSMVYFLIYLSNVGIFDRVNCDADTDMPNFKTIFRVTKMMPQFFFLSIGIKGKIGSNLIIHNTAKLNKN